MHGARAADRQVVALQDTGEFRDRPLVSQKSASSEDIRGDQIPWVAGEEPGWETIGLLMSHRATYLCIMGGEF